MTLVRVKPALNNRRSFHPMNRLFDEFFKFDAPVGHKPARNGQRHSPVNVIETADGFHIQLAAPGMAKSDFEIKLDKDILSIQGKRVVEDIEGETFRRREFGNFEFNRFFRLPETVNGNAVEATYKNGILELVIPKREEAKEQPARKIEIA